MFAKLAESSGLHQSAQRSHLLLEIAENGMFICFFLHASRKFIDLYPC